MAAVVHGFYFWVLWSQIGTMALSCFKFPTVVLFVAILAAAVMIVFKYDNFYVNTIHPQVKKWGSFKSSDDIQPFQVHVTDTDLDALRNKLLTARYSENPESDTWDYGQNLTQLRDLIKFWGEEFNWRAQEEYLNSMNQYTTVILGISVHYVHIKCSSRNCQHTTPVMLIHGWPGSFFEFYELIPLLLGDQSACIDIVVPSIPYSPTHTLELLSRTKLHTHCFLSLLPTVDTVFPLVPQLLALVRWRQRTCS